MKPVLPDSYYVGGHGRTDLLQTAISAKNAADSFTSPKREPTEKR
jgi:hypothetical protein